MPLNNRLIVLNGATSSISNIKGIYSALGHISHLYPVDSFEVWLNHDIIIIIMITRVKNYTCLRNTTHRRLYVSTYIAFLRVVMLNFLRGLFNGGVN